MGCQSDAGWIRDDVIFTTDGGMHRVALEQRTYLLLEDDSYWHHLENIEEQPYSYRRRLDGSIIQQLEYFTVYSATQSGWISLRHWGTWPGEIYEVIGPDGGIWPREGTNGYIVDFNEDGVGIGPVFPRKAIRVWRDGKEQTNDYVASACVPLDINDLNVIVGERVDPSIRATVFWGREYAEAVVPVGGRSTFWKINNSNVAVGDAAEINDPVRIGWGIAWARGSTVVLDEVVQDAGIDCRIHTATDINDFNQVVGVASCGDAGRNLYSTYRLRLEITSGGR
ncbi:MAG: hypothetical protein DI536_32900 [Archangium gephyra]|uniref:Uncharacterized protein n=1 Tax=Archangium gephyra TaxID=48 RepID=A0A2W5STX2_9BACT|nr:MAG: hypothetical protein DI536_32900 [Archangium gephyra]